MYVALQSYVQYETGRSVLLEAPCFKSEE